MMPKMQYFLDSDFYKRCRLKSRKKYLISFSKHFCNFFLNDRSHKWERSFFFLVNFSCRKILRMGDILKVNNVLIHEGDRTYTNEEVQSSERLSSAVHRIVTWSLITLYERINSENGILHLTLIQKIQ